MAQIFSISPADSGKLMSIERIMDWQRDAYRQIMNERLLDIINLIIHLPVLLPHY
jgi:hypothetical protein